MAGRPEQRVRGLLWRRSLEQTRESAGAQQAGQWSVLYIVYSWLDGDSLTHSFSGRAMD